MTFDQRYGAGRIARDELFDQASRYIPAGAGSSARTAKFGWRPYPPFMAEGTGSRLRDVDGHEYVDYLLGLGPMILGHRHPVVTRAVTDAIADLGTCLGLPYELEIEAARKVVEAVPGRRPGPVLELRQRGGGYGGPAGARLHRPAAGDPVRGALPRLAGHGLLEQPRRPGRRRARPACRGRCRPGPASRRAGRHAHRAELERPGELRRGHGRARRRGGGRDHRAGHVQHRVHPARARLPGAAARGDPQARGAAHLRRGDHRVPVRPGRRAGVLRRDPGPDHAWPRAWAAGSRSPPSAAAAR